ncbi:MAG TPA: hypothetical protein VMJ65_30165 [Solirubrobacteraceae bacterium]|nr:hypothetical protein [Solirubrobacteraceae bacterium]
MSTLEASRQTQRGRARFRTRLLALGTLIAGGAAALILALSGANHASNTHPAIGTQARPYVPPAAVGSAGPAVNFRDPTTHKLGRVSTTAAATKPAPASHLTPQSTLQSLTPTERHYVLGIAALSRSQQAAAFGTDPGLSGLTARQVKELDQLQSAARHLGLHPGVFGTASQR